MTLYAQIQHGAAQASVNDNCSLGSYDQCCMCLYIITSSRIKVREKVSQALHASLSCGKYCPCWVCVSDELKKEDWVFTPGLCFIVHNFRTSSRHNAVN